MFTVATTDCLRIHQTNLQYFQQWVREALAFVAGTDLVVVIRQTFGVPHGDVPDVLVQEDEYSGDGRRQHVTVAILGSR